MVYPADRIDIDGIPYPRFYTIFGAQWLTAETAKNGMLDIAQYRNRPDSGSACVLLRHITSTAEAEAVSMQFGFSDEATLFLNGKKQYYGKNSESRPDSSFMNPVDWKVHVTLQLERGLNEIFFIVKDSAGAWGIAARTDRPLTPPVWRTERLTPLWQTDRIFTTPESVVWDEHYQRFYVTNFDNRANLTETDPAKYTGYISILDPQGKIIEERWAQGLHAPAGMVIAGDTLFTAERRTITAIDRETGSILERFPIPDPDFPNDIAAGPDGTLYITDTAPSDPYKSRIYRFKNGVCDIWRSGEEVWRPNGIFVSGNSLIFGGNPGDGNLKSVDLVSGRMEKIASLGAGVIDGIRVLPEGGFLVSHWEGRIYEISPKGEVIILADHTGSFNAADFEYVPEKRMIVIPTFVDNRVVAFRLREPGGG
ncbi:SMP-30/gluconolactonase/LRE family protein [bacterium]|nr:SMP-30/gluconolactonase/LRE family protein [bacterium]